MANNNNCGPTRPMSPAATVADPCAYLQALREAQLALLSGQQRKQIRHGDAWVEFQASDARALEALILQYERRCANAQGGGPRAYRAGNFVYPRG